jgi:hypothetical protein
MCNVDQCLMALSTILDRNIAYIGPEIARGIFQSFTIELKAMENAAHVNDTGTDSSAE